jgi:superfamily II DNA/RNA helicase
VLKRFRGRALLSDEVGLGKTIEALMELYNLITLLKPGQLETARSFREKFMKRGDPTDPRNKALLDLIRSSGEKLIVFVKYRGTVDHLAKFLEWNRVSFSRFHGGMDNAAKDREITAFKEKAGTCSSAAMICSAMSLAGSAVQACCKT